jgi:virulence factor Mce-like protein
MRRVAAIALVLGACAAAAAVLPGVGAQGSDTYRVDAIFDTSKGIIPGQLVKIAGARVGEVKDVRLTRDYKARIQLEVQRRFAPFRTDATCSIQPEGLISENFVQCDPGTPEGRPLRGRGDEAPTVPVERTTVPVSLNDFFNVWNVPTRERLTVLVNELGIGLAGRGEDLNEVLRRANPSLTLARRTIALLNRQRSQLASMVTSTDRVVAELAARRDRVQDFIEQAARVTTQTADHSGPLAEAIRRLPPFLAAARPALRRLDELAAAGGPLLRELRTAAPGLNRLVGDLEPFADAGVPALRGLSGALRTARRATRSSRPVIAQARRFTRAARPLAPIVSGSFIDLRDRGFIENGLRFVYFGASAAARFDRISHILPAHVIFNECAQYSTTPVAACSARFSGPGPTPRSQAPRSRAPAPRPGAAPAPAATAPAGPAAPPPNPAPPPRPPAGLDRLLDDVARTLGGDGDRGRAVEDLLGYLLQ